MYHIQTEEDKLDVGFVLIDDLELGEKPMSELKIIQTTHGGLQI
jgi:hypothetical protein